MVVAVLTSGLIGIYLSENTEDQAALQYAQAVSALWTTGMTGFGNSVANASSVVNSLKAEIAPVYKDKSITSDTQAKIVAKAIDNAFKTLMTAGPAIQQSLSGFGKAGLEADLKNIYSSENTSAQAANMEAVAIMKYSMNSLVTGIIPGVPPVPVAGPIM